MQLIVQADAASLKMAIAMSLLLPGCSSPRISFKETSHDFGRMDAMTRLSLIFIFKNAVRAPVRICIIQYG